jgi:hypothetical protein
MRKLIGIGLVVLGGAGIVWGSDASASMGSQISRVFMEAPPDTTIWIILGGVAATAAGLGLLPAPRRSLPPS